MEETTPRKKTRSLTLAPTPDPVSRMREIHDLDSPVSALAAEQETKKSANKEILQARNIASNEEIKKVMRAGLKAPYPEGSLKTPGVTVTTRLPAEICQRLEWATQITNSKKQEVITEALRLYFEHLADDEV